MLQEKSIVISNRVIGPDTFHMVCATENMHEDCSPGQFINVKINNTTDPLLRRPFCLYSFSEGKVEFIYKIVGYGTSLLADKEPGDEIDLLGPLGRGFIDEGLKGKKVYVVGGGMGIVPLFPFVKHLCDVGIEFEVLNGARTDDELFLKEVLCETGACCSFITDHPGEHRSGLVTELLEEKLIENAENAYVFCCGPHPMIKAVVKVTDKYNVPCQVSLEEKMACGLGACVGCIVESVDRGNIKVCKDGPVFLKEEIKW